MKDPVEHPPIEEQLKRLPTSPGVYLMKAPDGTILYIGKAANLRSRVRSYFRASGDGRYAVRFLAKKTTFIDYIVTGSEKEALFLEDTLLKKHKPKYNIRLKDSKTYVSIKISLADKFPRILITRQIKKDGSRYFGPYVSANAVRAMVKMIRKVFPLCVRSSARLKNTKRPCLDYQLGLCSAPGAGMINEADYRAIVEGAILFLSGRNSELLKNLKKEMNEASAALDYEKAAIIRDRILAIESMLETQKVVSHRGAERDVFAMARGPETLVMQVLFVRGGRLVNSLDYSFTDCGLSDSEIISSFLAQFYKAGRIIPKEILIEKRPDDSAFIEQWLSEKAGRRVKIIVPRRGEKYKLLKMAKENADESLEKKRVKSSEQMAALEELAKRLRMKAIPRWIEAFDISNTSGSLGVGAMVSFREGEPDKAGYRLFRIKGVTGQDDFAMMEEVMRRRYAHADEEQMPDLVLLDGGKGQLGVAMRVMAGLGLHGSIALAALAKERPEDFKSSKRAEKAQDLQNKKSAKKSERIFLPGAKDAIILRQGSRADMLLCRIRDEVHRTAIGYQRKLRNKKMFDSPLDGIRGIGERRKKTLLNSFGSLKKLIEAPLEEICGAPGITREMARAIKALKKKPTSNKKSE